MVGARSLSLDVRTYSRLALSSMRRRYKIRVPRKWSWQLSQYFCLPAGDAGMLGTDAVLAYERYPINAKVPVIWITGPTEIPKLKSRGLSDAAINEEIMFKREASSLAAATVLTTRHKQRLFEEVIRPQKPTCVIPFFLPIESAPRHRVEEKWLNAETLRLVFIGRAAHRKGLPLVLDAFRKLIKTYPGRFSLTVVSSLSDGHIDIPAMPGLRHVREVSHEHAIELMAQAHYLLMPSVLESYGWVYAEAMAQGTIPLATDQPVQRDILDDGRAGLLVERDADKIASAISQGVLDVDGARALAFRGYALWHAKYAPQVVAMRFAELAKAAKGSA
jgi:glycosyltransferase involved in cell wall biosynthesis